MLPKDQANTQKLDANPESSAEFNREPVNKPEIDPEVGGRF
jgi:hypothetical protein